MTKKYKYTLMVEDAGVYFGDSIWELIKEIIKHRTWHFKRGDGWVD